MIRISHSDLDFQKTDDSGSLATGTALLATMAIGPHRYHVEAYAVTGIAREDDADGHAAEGVAASYGLVTVDPSLQEKLDAVCTLVGAKPQTTQIDGREYVLAVFPFSP
jgi:hypothetical protein